MPGRLALNAPILQIGSDFYEDIDGRSPKKLIADCAPENPVRAGPANSRHSSEPEGGLTSLTENRLRWFRSPGAIQAVRAGRAAPTRARKLIRRPHQGAFRLGKNGANWPGRS